MWCEKSRNELLAARDARQAALVRAMEGFSGTILALALNIPGAQKRPPGAAGLFAWGGQMLAEAIPDLRPLHGVEDPLGPFALFATGLDARPAKRCALAIEAAAPPARLLDIDCYDGTGMPVDRLALGEPQRACLLCPRPARECIRAGRHSCQELARRVHELLAHLPR